MYHTKYVRVLSKYYQRKNRTRESQQDTKWLTKKTAKRLSSDNLCILKYILI